MEREKNISVGNLILQKQLISRYRKVVAERKLRQNSIVYVIVFYENKIRKIGWGSPKLVL